MTSSAASTTSKGKARRECTTYDYHSYYQHPVAAQPRLCGHWLPSAAPPFQLASRHSTMIRIKAELSLAFSDIAKLLHRVQSSSGAKVFWWNTTHLLELRLTYLHISHVFLTVHVQTAVKGRGCGEPVNALGKRAQPANARRRRSPNGQGSTSETWQG